MTSDAKIGLLLGFVFILVIISLVNGLPELISKDSPKQVPKTSAPVYDDRFDLDGKASEVVRYLDDLEIVKGTKRKPGIDDDHRFQQNRNKASDSSDKNKSPGGSNSGQGRFYIVQKNDVLGKISRKVYGDQIGKKQSTINMIFQANSNILNSPDDIYVGQKLFMPVLDSQKELPDKEGVFAAEEEKDESPLEKITTAVKNVFSRQNSSPPLHVKYIVKEHDSLWAISSKRLGNGSRWREIKKINNGLLEGSDEVEPGMELKLPKK